MATHLPTNKMTRSAWTFSSRRDTSPRMRPKDVRVDPRWNHRELVWSSSVSRDNCVRSIAVAPTMASEPTSTSRSIYAQCRVDSSVPSAYCAFTFDNVWTFEMTGAPNDSRHRRPTTPESQ